MIPLWLLVAITIVLIPAGVVIFIGLPLTLWEMRKQDKVWAERDREWVAWCESKGLDRHGRPKHKEGS